MNDKHKKTHQAYEDLLKSYFGSPHLGRLPMPPGARPISRSAEAVLGSYYGKTLPRLHHPLRYGQYGHPHRHLGHQGIHDHAAHHGHHHGHHSPHGHDHKDHASHVISQSMDDGEILAAAGQNAIEEYVVARSLSDQDEAEYVVARSMSDEITDEYVVEHFSNEASMSYGSSLLDAAMPDPQQEFNTDILAPLKPLAPLQAMPANSDSSGLQNSQAANPVSSPSANGYPAANASGAGAAPAVAAPAQPSTPVRPQSLAVRAPDRLPMAMEHHPDPNPSTATEEDFMADMQSILSGESVFDPVTRKTVNKNDLARGETTPSPSRQDRNQERSNQQDIFDRIAQSMQFANAYDLGTVELENRFADFDRVLDQKPTTAPAKGNGSQQSPATVSKAASTSSPVSTADFLEDLETVNNSERSSYSGVDDAAFSMDATTTELKGAFVSGALQTVFTDAASIDQYFSNQGAANFIDWFNGKVAKKGPWAGKSIGSGSQANFKSVWDRIPQIFGSNQINLLQFLSLMSIFINEVGGTLGPISEKVGMKGHPGLAYPFDQVPEIPKASYNDGGSSWTAYQCFNDPDFIKAHGQKALGNTLANTQDERWKGHVYPDDMPTDVNPSVTGFIMEADFYKFRGRGMIQTTWRGGYKKLIQFIQNYSGTQPEILSRKQAWAGLSLDQAANVSSNGDWDALFMHTDLEIPCVAIAQHNTGAGNYLNLSGDVDVLNSHNSGSIWNVGKRISGGTKYANLFRSRVITICNLLGNADA